MGAPQLTCEREPLPPLPAGALVGRRFIVVRELKYSARSSVYLVGDRRDSLLRILKRTSCRGGIDCSCGRSYDLAYELTVLRRLASRRVRAPRPVDQLWAAGGFCIVTSFVEGRGLDALAEAGRVSPALALCIARQLAAALAAAHQLGIVHHDVKPPHVIVGRSGRATLIDWDAAARVRPAGEPLVRRAFTPGYASLEQLAGAAVPSNDVYGLGRLLDEVLPRPGPLLGAIIRRATAPLPRRYPDAVALGRDLRRLWQLERVVRRVGLTLLP
jgi:serine/threonine-protein kinase